MPEYTTDELIQCAVRELGMRKRVYPGWISAGRMSAAKADREIGMMAAILDMLKHLDELPL